MRQITHSVYTFAELTEEAKERVIARFRNDCVASDILTEDFTEDCNSSLENDGFDDFKVYWSLSSCQGDGVSFTQGYKSLDWWKGRKFVSAAILKGIRKQYRDCVEIAFVNNDSRYCHHNTVSVDIKLYKDIPQPDYEKIEEFAKSLNEWRIAKCREFERNGYEMLYPDDSWYVDYIEGNEYEFYANGDIARAE